MNQPWAHVFPIQNPPSHLPPFMFLKSWNTADAQKSTHWHIYMFCSWAPCWLGVTNILSLRETIFLLSNTAWPPWYVCLAAELGFDGSGTACDGVRTVGLLKLACLADGKLFHAAASDGPLLLLLLNCIQACLYCLQLGTNVALQLVLCVQECWVMTYSCFRPSHRVSTWLITRSCQGCTVDWESIHGSALGTARSSGVSSGFPSLVMVWTFICLPGRHWDSPFCDVFVQELLLSHFYWPVGALHKFRFVLSIVCLVNYHLSHWTEFLVLNYIKFRDVLWSTIHRF